MSASHHTSIENVKIGPAVEAFFQCRAADRDIPRVNVSCSKPLVKPARRVAGEHADDRAAIPRFDELFDERLHQSTSQTFTLPVGEEIDRVEFGFVLGCLSCRAAVNE